MYFQVLQRTLYVVVAKSFMGISIYQEQIQISLTNLMGHYKLQYCTGLRRCLDGVLGP